MTDQTYVRAKEGEDFEKLDSDTLRTVTRTVRAANHHPTDDGYYRCCLPQELVDELLQDRTINTIVWDRSEEPNPLIQGTIPAIYGLKFYPIENPPKGYLNVTVRGLPVSIE